ncbi:MAG: phosphodiester glycosidase family protein [Eubacteriales bacterium]|nr:phosphodiester glycosidase family protein [Eubacteriales bacterium]
MALLTALVIVMAAALTFALPSGAILSEAETRYQESVELNWDDEEDVFTPVDESASRIRVLASAALSDILPANDVSSLPMGLNDAGSAPIAENFTENGYRDDTIIVDVQELRQDDSTYHVAYIKVATPSQIRTAVAGGKLGSNRTLKTSMFAQSMNAVVAINGDFYTQTKAGYIIRQGETYRTKTSKNMDLLLIDENGDFHILLRGHDEQAAGIKELTREHQIVNGFFFGPALVVDGVKQDIPEKYQFAPFAKNPRAAVGQITALTYVVVTVDGRIDSSAGVTLPELASFMESIGCQQAYNLDGGNSSALIFNGKMMSVKDVEERSVSDILYFASAVQ